MASSSLGKELECPICQALYTDPVTLRCGHNFCRGCIERVLNTQDESGDYSCPECREQSRERPALTRNITLGNVVENVQYAHANALIHYTYFVASPVPAMRSSLHYAACPRDKHLKDQGKGPHHLTDPCTSLEIRKCSAHNEILQYYCPEDAACICVYCNLAGEHRGHRVEKLDEASEKKKRKLRNVHLKLIYKRENAEERVCSLEILRRKAQEKASGEAERVTALFIDIRKRLEDLEKRLLSEMCRRAERVSLSLSAVIKKLERKKDELSGKMRDIEELCIMSDPLTVLQEPYTGVLCDPEEEGGGEVTGGHDGGDEDMGGHDGGDGDTGGHDGGDEDTGGQDGGDEVTGGHYGDKWGVTLISHLSYKLSAIIRGVNVTFYVQDPAEILLDVNTAHDDILVSDDLKTATLTWNMRNPTEAAERFLDYYQVMSSSSFTSGRHYWDLKIRASKWWSVGMCYPSIDKSGESSFIGDNNKSWALCGGTICYDKYSVMHDGKEILLGHQSASDQVRIYVDYEAGHLSFFELCDPIRHLFTYFTAFSEPLHAGLWINNGAITMSGGVIE